MNYKQYDTTKLFYKKYLYKVVIKNNLSTYFASYHSKKYTNEKLQGLERDLASNQKLVIQRWRTQTSITESELVDARKIFNSLEMYPDYRIRVEMGYNMTIFTNSVELVDKFKKEIKYSIKGIWQPSNNMTPFLLQNIDTAIVKTKTPYEFRVYFNGRRIDPNFAEWLKNNTDKSKIGEQTLRNIELGCYSSGNYFYIKNEKVLTMIRLIMGHNIQKVERLVYKGDIDK